MKTSATFTGDTKVIGRVGIKPSNSGNTLYNPLLTKLNQDIVYIQFVIEEGKTKEYIDAIKTLNILGTSVTGPHTHAMMELVDEIDESAKITHHGNTLVNKDGHTTLYSTDAYGMVSDLKSRTDIGDINSDEKGTIFTDNFLEKFDVLQDVSYRPPVTEWTQRAEKLGKTVILGSAMFAHQGAQQLRLFTGIEPDMTIMEKMVHEGLLKA